MGFTPLNPTKAVIDGLGIDADTVDGHHGHAPTKAAHDGLGLAHSSLTSVGADDHRHVEAAILSNGNAVQNFAFSTAFAATPVCVATSVETGGTAVICQVQSASTTSVDTITRATSSGGTTNARHVIAMEAT